jgi:hypothetical protein
VRKTLRNSAETQPLGIYESEYSKLICTDGLTVESVFGKQVKKKREQKKEHHTTVQHPISPTSAVVVPPPQAGLSRISLTFYTLIGPTDVWKKNPAENLDSLCHFDQSDEMMEIMGPVRRSRRKRENSIWYGSLVNGVLPLLGFSKLSGKKRMETEMFGISRRHFSSDLEQSIEPLLGLFLLTSSWTIPLSADLYEVIR